LRDALETTFPAGLAPEELRRAEEALMRHRTVVIVDHAERRPDILDVLREMEGDLAGAGADEPAARAPRFRGGAWVSHCSALKEAQSS
jgi:hypothetical protein